jgi:hypothetical protein
MGELWLEHWHCIIPAAAIIVGFLLMNRGKKQKNKGPEAALANGGKE